MWQELSRHRPPPIREKRHYVAYTRGGGAGDTDAATTLAATQNVLAGSAKEAIDVSENNSSQGKALALLKEIYDRTRTSEEPVFVEEIAPSVNLSAEEAFAAWRYLKDKRLIQTFSIDGTARINANGIHAIEDSQSPRDRPSSAFPGVTYQTVHNTINIETATNSPIQQSSHHSTQHQTINFSNQDRDDLEKLVSELSANLSYLGLQEAEERKARAQIATIKAQLIDEPDVNIVRQSGKTLRNITEGAIASLIAASIQPTVWSVISDILTRLFQ